MGCWVNVWNFRKTFFSKFQHFILFWEWVECYFWIPHPKLIKVPIFIKIQWTRLKIWTKMDYHRFPRRPQEDEREGLWSKLFITISQKIFEIEAWNLVLWLIFKACIYMCFKFYWNLRRWVSGMSHFDVEFPKSLHNVSDISSESKSFTFLCLSPVGLLGAHLVILAWFPFTFSWSGCLIRLKLKFPSPTVAWS